MCFFYWVASLIWKDMTELWMVVVRILVGPARSIFYFCPSPTKDSATRVVCYSLINTEGGVTTTDSSTNTHTHSHAHRVHCLVLKRPFSERPLPVRLGSEFVSFPRLWTSPPPPPRCLIFSWRIVPFSWIMPRFTEFCTVFCFSWYCNPVEVE